MKAQQFLGLVVLVLSLGYLSLLYPLPNQRIAEIVSAQKQMQQQIAPGASKSQENRLSFDPVELVNFLWVGWWLALVIVVSGIVAGAIALRANSNTWRVAMLAFCVVYLVIYWSQVVLPMGKPLDEFIGFKMNTIGSLIRIGAVGRLTMELHQTASAIVFHLMALYLLITAITARKKSIARAD